MSEFQNISWNLSGSDGKIETWGKVQIAVLMDIRRELNKLNNLLACPNFVSIPRILQGIKKNTARQEIKEVKAKAPNKQRGVKKVSK